MTNDRIWLHGDFFTDTDYQMGIQDYIRSHLGDTPLYCGPLHLSPGYHTCCGSDIPVVYETHTCTPVDCHSAMLLSGRSLNANGRILLQQSVSGILNAGLYIDN